MASRSRPTGGSQALVPARKRIKGPDRKETEYKRAIEILGEDTVLRMRVEWASWETEYGGREWEQSEGVILQLLQQGLSERIIRAILPVGGYRIDRLRKVLKDGIDTLHTRRPQLKPWHAFSDADTNKFKKHCSTWELEDGFPCPHRRPRQYFTEPKLTWKVIHARYEYEIDRVLGLSVTHDLGSTFAIIFVEFSCRELPRTSSKSPSAK